MAKKANVHEIIAARKAPIEAIYREAKHLSLDEFLKKVKHIIGSLTSTQISLYTRIYAQERNN